MFRLMKCVLVFTAVLWAVPVMAEDAYYNIPLDKLELTEGSLPKLEKTPDWRYWQLREYVRPYVVINGEGEGYVEGAVFEAFPGGRANNWEDANSHLAVCAPAGRDITGRLFIPKPDWSGYELVKFKIPASAADKDAKNGFLQIKASHYQKLMNRNIPGGAWYRHQLRDAQKALGLKPSEQPNFPRGDMGRWNRFGDVDSTYDLFTGGRAISENLQLDRIMPVRQSGEETVAVDSLEGITIQEIDWKPLLKDLNPKLDPLAEKVPCDQHVVFFPTFQSALTLSDESKKIPGLFFKMAEAHSGDTSTNALYEKQLCLTVSGLSRLLGPKLVKSMALTGSDPYFFTGTDMAVIFEAPEPVILEQLLLAQVSMKAQVQKDVKPISGNVGDVSYKGFRSPDRSVCSYVARLNGMVVVTNSPYQLERLASVVKGETKPIASLDEYKFFRSRYTLGDADETAFFFLSDVTIRRWCGPRWRIATSRRIRDAAVIADLQASQLDKLVEGKAQAGPIYTDLSIAEKSELQLTPNGVVSSTLGSFDFMTPIAEIPLDRVTKAEAEAYKRWRDGYQSNWRWAFDPIALRVGVDKKKISADLTVMPLIWGTEYREFVNVSHGAKFPADAADLHDSLGHYILAINKESQHARSGANFMRMMAPGVQVDPLGWLGNYVSLYVDDDPIWDELAKVDQKDIQKFLEKNAGRLPVALRADVSSGFKLTAFLVALRAFVDQTSPGMTNWETLTYKEQSYVKITPTERARGRNKELENLAIYYVASGDYLLVTLNEALLKRSIDRQLAREEAEKKGEKPPEIEHPWLAENMAIAVKGKLVQVAAALSLRSQRPNPIQAASWNNLPILNEWKRRYPNEDPVKLHARFWHEELSCPGGGDYVWNEKWQTMESSVFGHPGQPKEGSLLLPIYQYFARGDFGLNFEEQGLRAKAVLTKPAE